MRGACLSLILVSSAVAGADSVTPTVTFGTPKVTGAVDAKLVATTVRTAQTKIAECHKMAIAKAPQLEGAAMVTFTIGRDGKPTAASATGLDAQAASCLAGVFSKLAFAKPADGKPARVSYPITFDRVTPDVSGSVDLPPISPYGIFGHASGRSSGYAAGGPDRASTGAGRGYLPQASLGKPTITGDLDMLVVRRYLKRSLQKLTYCYEKQLFVTATLQGTITLDFTIAGNGRVSASVAKGVHEDVETCMAGVVKATEFPAPPSARDVKVSYPITVNPTGG